MTTVIFDSQRLVKRLVGEGFEEKQAEADGAGDRQHWRRLFAAHVMSGLLAGRSFSGMQPGLLAKQALAIADAMLEQKRSS